MLVSGFSLIIATPVRGDVTVTAATGGDAISADTCPAGADTWTSLNPITIAENLNNDFAIGQTDVTLILHAPAGFQFRAGVNPSISETGDDITAIVVTSTTATDITITFTTGGAATTIDSIVIGQTTPIDVQPTAGTPLASGNILNTGSTATIVGVDGATNFGTLTEVAGAVTSLSIEQQPMDTLVNENIFPAVTVRATDQFTNNVSAQNITVAKIAGTGTLTGTSPQLTDANGIAAFDDLQIDTAGPDKQLQFTNPGDDAISNFFNITFVGITVNPTAGLVTSEAGDTANFTIVLTSQPTDNVTIGLVSSDLTEGTLSADNVTFSNVTWYIPQTITVTGVDDTVPDGDIPYTIITAPAVSADVNYNTLNASDISVTNLNDEVIIVPAPEPPGSVTNISDIVTDDGIFTEQVTVSSADNNVQLTIDQGTTGTTANGQPLSQLIIMTMNYPPNPPEQSSIIGLAYDFRPEGATFDELVTITFTYDPDNIPAGVNEEDLSIAFYDDTNGEWVVLQNINVDPSTHTITGQTTHFTPFTVLAFTGPASFTVSDLVLSPSEIYAGETATVSVTVTNTGDLSGTYSVVLKVDYVVTETKQVTLEGHDSQTVDFSVTLNTAGTYNIGIGILSGVLTVTGQTTTPAPAHTQKPAPTATQTPAPPPTPEVVPSPPEILTEHPTPTQETTPAQTAAPTPASVTAESGTNWGLIGGIIGGIVIVVGVLGFWITHRRD